MKTLKLFNAVVKKESNRKPFVSELGYIIEPNAMWAKDQIVTFYEKQHLSGESLNKTFHKSWEKILTSSRFELFVHQITHYITTYGSNFKDEIYIPDEVLNLPEIKLKYKVIKSYTKEELIKKSLYMLQSGVALKEETINDLLSVLTEDLAYIFTGKENIKNKEAIIKIADLYNVLPVDTMEFFRYIIYRATGESLLIKNEKSVQGIKESNFNPNVQFKKFGLQKLATIFNRFKPLFLAFKDKCPKTINKISKLSKSNHKPLIENPLNKATSEVIKNLHWLDNATPYVLFKALSGCYARYKGQSSFVYRIRNGKSWVAESKINIEVCKQNCVIILNYLKKRFSLQGKKIKLPADIIYGLPTSEKMYVGIIPTGTRFFGDKLAVGVYWQNSGGANDLDLSGININGKVGWNSTYNQSNGDLMYSGDITSAPKGAVEYLYANEGLSNVTLIQNNVYSGDDTCHYKIIIGKGDSVNYNYMMNPEKVFAHIDCQSVQKQTILGLFMPVQHLQCFVLLNFGAGNLRVSGISELSNIATKALYQQWSNGVSFNKLIKILGAEIVNDNADYDLSLDSLEKDSFIKLFCD
jgi:hypothetical protein